MEEDRLSRTVFLHVGVAKTGTTYLQRLLFANRELLRSAGVLYPGQRPEAHFLASMDLRDAGLGGHKYPAAAGRWAKLANTVNCFDGTAVISHETLSRARRPAIQRAIEAFETDDIRVVLTTRDLGRQIPAVWQENVKNRNPQTYADFLHGVLVGVPPAKPGPGKPDLVRLVSFWWPQNLPKMVGRWAPVVGTDKVVLVTVPPLGSPRDELWKRFATAVELPVLDYEFDVVGENVSLGAAEAELMRRVIAYVPAEVDWPRWKNRVKRGLGERTLASMGAGGRILVPKQWHDVLADISEQMIADLAASGVRVVGDLDDLRPRFDQEDGLLPDDVSDAELLECASAALAQMASAPPEHVRSVHNAPTQRPENGDPQRTRGEANVQKEKPRRG
ncbi:MAG TPA: hypothetical protein VH419_06580 [Nocardioidaceae bacterium]